MNVVVVIFLSGLAALLILPSLRPGATRMSPETRRWVDQSVQQATRELHEAHQRERGYCDTSCSICFTPEEQRKFGWRA